MNSLMCGRVLFLATLCLQVFLLPTSVIYRLATKCVRCACDWRPVTSAMVWVCLVQLLSIRRRSSTSSAHRLKPFSPLSSAEVQIRAGRFFYKKKWNIWESAAKWRAHCFLLKKYPQHVDDEFRAECHRFPMFQLFFLKKKVKIQTETNGVLGPNKSTEEKKDRYWRVALFVLLISRRTQIPAGINDTRDSCVGVSSAGTS